jgi:hypothetical protein
MQSSGGDRWAKCDMLYVLSIGRLDLPRGARNPRTGKRVYQVSRVGPLELLEIRRSMAAALNIRRDTFPEPEETATAPASPAGTPL